MMKLMQIHVENFRCFEQETVSFQSGENRILAHNAQGKSTLMEAVVWCLYGTALGKKNADTRLLRRGARSMKVETVWQNLQGQSLTILRIKPEQGRYSCSSMATGPNRGGGRMVWRTSNVLIDFLSWLFQCLEPKEAKLVLDVSVKSISNKSWKLFCRQKEPIYPTFILGWVGFGGCAAQDPSIRTQEHEEEALRLEGAIESWKAKLAEPEPEPFQSTLGEAKLAEIAATQKELTRLELLLEKVPQEIKELQTRLQQARSYMEVKQQLLPDIDANCPTCHQPLPKTQQKSPKTSATPITQSTGSPEEYFRKKENRSRQKIEQLSSRSIRVNCERKSSK
ncbi:AAA family ATPase (plasmid) [Alicyclobacillus sp. TC]|uniref:AAA family ATPase n=1 Tax=Alicyclobacillus sp. TC TaxID=2606450 RepID=UPI0019343880|nr:AAA family ATPase [Alicyclobacillus sp. TC]QRF24820.1 AAA family ATPase [Alicyclobacillus sp. TC]